MKSNEVRVRRPGNRQIAIALALGVAVPLVATASAGAETLMNIGQTISAGNAKGSGGFARTPMKVEGKSDHTWCPAVGVGYAGYTSNPFGGGNSTWYSSCGPGSQIWSLASNGSSYHGVVYNPNGATADTFQNYYWLGSPTGIGARVVW